MRLTILAGLAVAALTGVGCGGTPEGPGYGSPDGRKISELIDRLNDDKSTSGTLKKLFAAGVTLTPDQVRKYPRYFYEVTGNPAVSGDTATASVKLTGERKSEEAGEQTWEFAKEGDAWKIKSAPLP